MQFTGFAVITVEPENTEKTVMLACAADRGVAEEAMQHFRQVLTIAAAHPATTDEAWQGLMASIRALRIIDVSVVQTEVL